MIEIEFSNSIFHVRQIKHVLMTMEKRMTPKGLKVSLAKAIEVSLGKPIEALVNKGFPLSM